MLFLPSHFHRRAEFYQRLGQFTSAGLSVIEGLEDMRQAPPTAGLKSLSESLLADLAQGSPLGEAFRKREAEFGPLDVALIEAGERAGRLPPSFHLLSVYYTERGGLAGTFLGQLSYPLFILHLGFLIFGVLLPWAQSAMQTSLLSHAFHTVLLILPLYSLVGLLIFAFQGNRGEAWRALVERLLAPVPLLGAGRRALALSRLAFALEALVAAGVGFVDAWPIAATASHSPRLQKIIAGWSPLLLAGQRPGELLRANRAFTGLFANLYATGETTGTLQDSLRRIAVHYQDEGVAKVRSFTSWMPRLIYLGIALSIGYRIVDFYRGYFKTIDSFFHP